MAAALGNLTGEGIFGETGLDGDEEEEEDSPAVSSDGHTRWQSS